MFLSIHISIIFIIHLINISHGQLVIKPSESIVLRDQFKSFVASCTGQPNTRVATWRSPLQIDIAEDDTARVTVERQTYGLRLRIRNLTRTDQGVWECLGSDQDGRPLSRTLQVNVKVPITFFGEPIQYAELNSAIIIKCRVLANPSAEVTWFKGRDKTRLTSSNYERSNDGLKILRVSLADNDIFWCQADVLETGESKDYPIQVIIAQGITPPRIVCAAPCAVEKQTATLICEAGGMPPPQFMWFYGQDVPIGTSGISKFVVRGNTLVINYVDETDNGRYSCQAFNDYDRRGQRAEYMLNVIVPPRLAPIPQIKVNLDENSPPQRAVFTCRVLRGSADSLSLEWILTDGTPVQPINGISIDVTQLALNHLIEIRFDPVRREHHGNYTCLAKNLADITSTIGNLFVEYRPVFIGPNAPVIFSVPNYRAIMKCQFDSYPQPTIQWVKMIRTAQEPDGGHVLVQDNDPQVIDILTRQIGPTLYETQLTYNPMEQDFGLNFECRAINPRIGRYSMNLRLAEPPRQVRVVEVKPKSNSIQLNIQPPLELGGLPLLEYLIKYEQIGIPNSLKTQTFPIVSNEPQNLRIETLQPSSLYRIQIVAKSRAGEGALSIPYQLKTLDRQVPQFKILSSDISCLDDQSCLIKWIIESDGGSPISRAEISYAKVRGVNAVEQSSPAIQLDPLTTEFELKGLQPDTNYLITLRLLSEAGVGEQKISKKTSKSRIDPRIGPSDKRLGRRYPSKWVIIGIVSGILFIPIITGIVFLIIRYCPKKNNENQTEKPPVPPPRSFRKYDNNERSSREVQKPLRDDDA
ncbi:unnamed protein product [Adineta steineri]|uniref:Uncharacterized protein n=1 Tax=Adineta steineri TaxID=433720 RepID=A0A819IYR3_9BILA|nr:unnamed protein product [Adineta steineri]CAF3925818.1 unnamed protein product [Adineta steineri]